MKSRLRSYRRLLRVFPASFRERYGEEMTRLYADRLHEVAEDPAAERRLAREATRDALLQAAGEWVRAARCALTEIFREGTSMEGWMQDLRIGARGLRRRPGFTVAAVTTLALGIGATAAIFSVVNGVLLRPLPYPSPERLMVLWRVDPRDGSRSATLDHPDVRYFQAEVPGLRLVGYGPTHPTLTGMGEPEVLSGARTTNGILDVFGLKPVLGRDITAEDDVPEGPNVVMVSYSFWENRLGGDRDVIGHALRLNGESWEVVGVAPEGFDYPDGAVVWVPEHHDDDGCAHGCNNGRAVARVEAGTTPEQVQARLDAASAQLAKEFPDAHSDVVATIEPMLDVAVADVKTALWVLMGAVGIVLLIACANVANLLLVRASDRVSEIALRATLGAPRTRIVRQLLTESLLLSLVGGVAGVGLAAWGIRVMVRLAPDGIPRLDEAGLDGRVLGFALMLVLAVTAVFGLAPALKLARRPLSAAAGTGRRAAGSRRAPLSRGALVSAEVALSLMLLMGAGLLLGTLRSMRAQELGFATSRVERFRVSLPEARYDTPAVIRFLEQLERRLDPLPEVEVAGTGFSVPFGSGNLGTSLEQLDREPVSVREQPSVTVRPASPGYREALALPLLRGRWFTDADQRDAEGVAVINRTAAERLYAGMDPLGRQLHMNMSWGFDDDPVRTIIGVVEDARSRTATEPDEPALYIPNAQFGAESVYVILRLAHGARTALPTARAVLKEMDPSLAVTHVERIEQVLDRQLAPTRFYLTLLGAFSVLAVILAAVGLYGVVAYSVSRRTREIGIRVALGARTNEVVGMAIREGVAPAVIGVAVGIGASLAGGRVLASLLYGVEPGDPATLVTVTTLLLAVALAATFVPARRASKVPPSEALRLE